MPYKVFVAGEEALAADANSFLMSQTVARFTNAAQRTSQLTAPVLNQLSTLDTTPGIIQYWNGSSWAIIPGTRTVAFSSQPNLSLPAPGNVNYPFQVNIPITGSFIVNAIATFQPVSGTTIQQVAIQFATASGGNPPIFTSVGYNSDAPFPLCSIPIMATYPVQAAGPVNLLVNAAAAAGGVVIRLSDLCGTVEVQP
jgi:hypothetical protein